MQRPILFALLLGFLFRAAPADAALVSAELRVDGLSCPFCAFGIEKKLLAVDGVQSVDVFLDEGRLSLRFDRENEATVSDLEKAVEKAGFELAGLRLTVRGEISGRAEGFLLLANPRMSFRLAERRGANTEPISLAALKRLGASTGQGGSPIVITGAVGERAKEEPTLVVESVGADKQ